MAGDFNHAELHENVGFLTETATSWTGSLQIPREHTKLRSDHISLDLTPSYRPVVRRSGPAVRAVQVWSEEAAASPQDCFGRTEWAVFCQGADLDTSAVLHWVWFP